MFRGDPSRNASTAGRRPLLNLRWRVEVTGVDILEKALIEQETMNREHGVAMFSGLHPLAIGDLVFMRTTTNVLAVDFQTGKRRWQTPEEKDPGDSRCQPLQSRVHGAKQHEPAAQYGQRIWDDATYGTISSDGSRLFVIEELPLGVGGPNAGFGMFGGRNDPSNRSITNKLVAYDIRTEGKVQWEMGGQESLQQSDAFFLGPPLPLRGQLYVMAEVKDELRLLALDGATGKLLWSQQLAMVEANITQDPDSPPGGRFALL